METLASPRWFEEPFRLRFDVVGDLCERVLVGVVQRNERIFGGLPIVPEDPEPLGDGGRKERRHNIVVRVCKVNGPGSIYRPPFAAHFLAVDVTRDAEATERGHAFNGFTQARLALRVLAGA